MKLFSTTAIKIVFIGCLILALSGCTVVLQKRHTSDVEKIASLSEQLEKLKMTKEELNKLKQAYTALERGLRKEIGEKKVSLEIAQKGLVVTIVDSVLFDSGKAKLRRQAHRTLNQVAAVCVKVVADREIGVEGHTDNQPIRYSGWESNWELSTARATSVLHYLVKRGVAPDRISATGYGKYRPIDTNATVQGRQKNRRVEIVILPEKIARVEQSAQGKYTK